jgi:PPOX class probable F420-dependent enzyme
MEPAHPSPTTSNPLPDPIRTFLEAPRNATIATISPDGAPHAAVVWYGLDGDDLLINSRAERHWPRNLVRDPRISFAVPDKDIPNHWVGVKGHALFLHDGDAALADIQALARRYGGNPDGFVGQNRVTYRVIVESTFEYGA